MNPLDETVSWLHWLMIPTVLLSADVVVGAIRDPSLFMIAAAVASICWPWVTWRVRRDLIRYKAGLIDPSCAFAVPIFRALERHPDAVDVTATRHGDTWRATVTREKDKP